MLAIHRGPDGFVPLATKHEGEWKELGAVDLSKPIPSDVVSHLDSDAYMALNSSFRTSDHSVTKERWAPIPGEAPGAEQLVSVRTTEKIIVRETGLPFASHGTANLRWLNACHTDMDCYKVGLSEGQALGAVIDLQDAGTLPPASVFVRSGRGVWALWLLKDLKNPETGTATLFGVEHGQNTPQRASVRAIALYAKIQRALADNLGHLGADLGALDAARLAPVPGTLKTAVDRRVTYVWQADKNGQPYLYTLVELATALGIDLTPPEKQHRVIREALPTTPTAPETRSALSKGGRKGWLARWQRTLGDFETLLNLRHGGLAQGHRNRGAYFLALVLGYSGMAPSAVETRVRAYGARCQPPMAPDEVQQVLASARRPKSQHSGYVSNARLWRELGVTAAEASYLQTAQEPEPTALPARELTRQARQRQILTVVREGLGLIPSVREMAIRLSALGHAVSHVTVLHDYQALGLNAGAVRSLQVA